MSVVRVDSCPSQSAMTAVSTPDSRSRIPQVWRSACGVIALSVSVGQLVEAVSTCRDRSARTASRLSRFPLGPGNNGSSEPPPCSSSGGFRANAILMVVSPGRPGFGLAGGV